MTTTTPTQPLVHHDTALALLGVTRTHGTGDASVTALRDVTLELHTG